MGETLGKRQLREFLPAAICSSCHGQVRQRHRLPHAQPAALVASAAAMIAHTGAATLTILSILVVAAAGGAEAAPLTPDWRTCNPGTRTPQADCCTLPDLAHDSGLPLHFKDLAQYLRERPLPARARVRRAAHLVAGNSTYLEQLNRAYQLMRDLPHTDPRSMFQQAHLHCMYGVPGADMVMQHGFPELEYSIHRNWLWLPFHRWQTFFFERILAHLVGDDQFTLPFWNWDDQSAELADGQTFLPNVIPHFYRNPEEYPALSHARRHPKHAPGNPDHIVDLSADGSMPDDRPDDIRRVNNNRLHTYVAWTSGAAPLQLAGTRDDQASALELEREPRNRFLSPPVHAGDSLRDLVLSDARLAYDFEFQLHGGLHDWVADPAHGLEDMGMTYSSVKDALFMTHHANVDRLWAVWQSLGGRESDDPDFLDAAFFFYDESAELVRVTVRDALDHRKLMIDWEHVDNPWLRYQGSPSAATA